MQLCVAVLLTHAVAQVPIVIALPAATVTEVTNAVLWAVLEVFAHTEIVILSVVHILHVQLVQVPVTITMAGALL